MTVASGRRGLFKTFMSGELNRGIGLEPNTKEQDRANKHVL